MIARILLLSLACCLPLGASQPKSTADLPDPNPEVQKAGFVVPEGLEVTLWAQEPMIQKPVQMNWDAQGRLWVVSSTTYPQIKPGDGTKDQVVVLEDTDGDGKADKSTVFAENLHIPTAVIPGDGGVYVANSTEVLFLKDTNGDLKEDERTVILSGFGTEDTHHLLHTMRHGPEGLLYFLQSIYIHSHIETPHGVRRLMGGGVWELRSETRRLEILSKGLINPWGFEFDKWGQSFATDGAGGEGLNYIFPGSVFKSSPGAARTLNGLSPGQPKQCGLEYLDDPHWPEEWRGTWVTNDFRGNRVNRFKLTQSGSGYIAKQEPDVLASNHRAFRPIDVRTGPDGALYIADWYNPIIQHGEVDFRDPRRDLVHGRIWRVTAKGRPLSGMPKISGAPVPELLEMLKSERAWTRHFAKRELRERGVAEVMPVFRPWADALPKETGADWHLMLEAAWTREALNRFSAKHWRELYSSPDARIRAAALRILTHRWRELPEALDMLKKAVADENAQVRLWALAVLSEMRQPQAFDAAVRALDMPMDENLDFLLELTAREQASIWLPAYQKEVIKLNENPRHLVYAMRASGSSEALKPLFDALKEGRLPAEDAAAALALAGDVADAAQAAHMITLAQDPALAAHLSGILDALVKAGTTRGIIPKDAEAAVTAWLADPRAEVVHRATLLAGAWKVENARATLEGILTAETTVPPVREGAMQGLSRLGGVKARDFFDQVFQSHPAHRSLAVQGLAATGPQLAAKRAVEFLASAKTMAEAAPILTTFLNSKQLPAILAKELAGKTIPEPIALEAVRMVSTRGIQGPLEDALRAAGGVKSMSQSLTPEQMAAMVEKVKTHGDAKRGEDIYRRANLLCQTCHAIGDAGGVLGPNLVSIGGSAPVDYLIESLLDPSAKIKEGYHMIILTTKDGGVISGGLVQDGNEEVIIRDPANQIQKIAKSQIASRQMSPASMMPPGLTASLREDEFVDLVRFMSELGREGEYKIKPNRFVRAWRVMGAMTGEQIDHVRHVGLHALHEKDGGYPWEVRFSKVSGALPLNEVQMAKMYPWFPKIAQISLKLDSPGKVKLGLSSTKAVDVVVGEAALKEITPELLLDLPAGTHPVTFVIGRDAGELASFSVEILEGAAQVAY
ncbi:MAG TPA: HEAT repeat domain-containing protein [Prosthecobacter sp.]|nr:HEAT repeat domain-containing protein [Prosthecobacter sp.]HRK14878.1 HEAT repeat domain-containing protein [Prosthecobacter sp.]